MSGRDRHLLDLSAVALQSRLVQCLRNAGAESQGSSLVLSELAPCTSLQLCFALPLKHELPLKLGDCTKHVEHQATSAGGDLGLLIIKTSV